MHFSTRTSRGGDGFYEMFSDLIFGVMAIFVLLFIILISLLRPPPPEITPPEKIDLVIAIDVSGSMGAQIAQLKVALNELGQNFPNLIDDFRVGLVAYRYNGFPSEVLHADIFQLKSMDETAFSSLEGFLNRSVVSRGGGVAPVYALRRGLELFGSNLSDEGRSRILVLIGDVASEYRTNGSDVYEEDYETSLAELRALSSEFTQQSAANRVLSIFSGVGKDQRHYRFFCNFADASGSKGRLVVGSSRLVWELLEELWKGSQEEVSEDFEPLTC